MPGNVDVLLFSAGFVVGATCIVALGVSLLEDHDRRFVVPATVAGALLGGAALGWALAFFFHFAGLSQAPGS